MKSKAYILSQIGELLKTNRGLCDAEVEIWIQENQTMTVYELLTFKKEISKNKEFPNLSTRKWFKGYDSE